MNIVFTALTVLSSITGFASSQKYDTCEEHLLDCMFEHFGNFSPLASPESILRYDDVYDMDGTNRYLLFDFADGETVIYDKKEECIFETFESNPYQGYNDAFKLLGDIEGEHMYAYFNEDVNDFTFLNNTSMRKNDIRSYFANQDLQYGNYYRNIAIPSNAHVISNAFYFENLEFRHAANVDGTCAVIASEILFGYYDTFVNDLIVDEQYDRGVPEYLNKNNPTIRDFSQSPGVDSPSVSAFHDYLCDIATYEVGDNPRSGGMTVYNQKQMMKKYLEYQGIYHQTYSSEGNFGDLIANKAKTVIKNTINDNRPVCVSGEGHCSVAYAYSDTMVWVHTGWGYTAATPWRTFESGMFYNYSAGAIDISNICGGAHICSDNYYVTNKNVYLCPQCGQVYKINDVLASDTGLSTSYYSDIRSRGFFEDDEYVGVMYHRAALLSNQYISLSARRSGEGNAFIEYWMTKKIRYVRLFVSFYSASEALSYNNSTVDLSVIKYSEADDEFYYEPLEDLLDIGISTDRNNQTKLEYYFVGDDVYGFSFSINAPATGNTDSGRFLIGDITIERSTEAHGLY